ncbi:hypothetical protein SEPCBS119000_000072 [Sporothrix epigloea]|uniref:Uncharacterized protein n=1 Tax=Sporothrix epigloea TaxID=1892477 RepID=A0ABP0D458_9PEZI
MALRQSDSRHVRRNSLDDLRLDEYDHTLAWKMRECCGTGSHYLQVPTLVGAENWNEWSLHIKTAALAEHVDCILTGSFRCPPRPAADCSTAQWNHWVGQKLFWERLNDNLISGIRSRSADFLASLIESETDAVSAYDRLQDHCQKRSGLILADLIAQLSRDRSENYDSVRDFSRVFQERLDKIDRMRLSWQIPEGLRQIMYLCRLGEDFGVFESMMTMKYNIAGIGDGPPVTLDFIMTKAAEYEANMTPVRLKRPAISAPAIARSPSSSDLMQPDRSKRRRPDSVPIKYKGPYRKVCSIHGWIHGSSNHDDSDCYQQRE